MRKGLVRVAVAGVFAAVTMLPVPAQAQPSVHPCHEYWPDGGHLIKWAEYQGAQFTFCMIKEIVGP